jgi:hypothetical protein
VPFFERALHVAVIWEELVQVELRAARILELEIGLIHFLPGILVVYTGPCLARSST